MVAQPAHAELDTLAHQRADCVAVGQALHLDRTAHATALGADGQRYVDSPRESSRAGIEVSDAALRLANALHLHLD